MKKHPFIFLVLMFLTGSCYYFDTSTYFVEIEEDYVPEIYITSNFDEMDSVVIYDSILFKFNIDIDTGRLYIADVYLDNSLIFRTDTISDSLYIFSNFVDTEGDHQLAVVSYYKSYSGSLADIYNAEYPYVDSVWNIQIYRDYQP